ncbi:MAG: TolC family protein [Bacteroidota bacterium]|nr:TolC family protein [Bacteroidota bacterium]
MINIRILYLNIFVILLLLSVNINAQTDNKTDSNILVKKNIKDESKSNLPSIAAIVDSALINSPVLKQQNCEIIIKQIEYKRTKINYLDYIKVFSDYKYGSVDNIFYAGGEAQSNTAVASRYNVGVGLSLSIFDLVDRKNNKIIADNELGKSKYKKDELVKNLTEEIITLYNDLLLAEKLVRIKGETRDAQELYFQIAEKQFREGQLNIANYTSIISTKSKSIIEYESVVSNYKKLYMLLEEIVGVKLNKIK